MLSTLANQLMLGEALNIIRGFPDELIDLTITSPPYNKKERNSGGLVRNVVYDGFKDIYPEKIYQDQQVEILNEIYRITKDEGSLFYNHKIRWERGHMLHPMDWLRRTKWNIRQEIIWDRTIAGNIRGWRFWQVEERIYWLTKPKNNNRIGRELSPEDAKLTSIWRAVPETKNPHPAPFPLWLPIRIILSILNHAKEALVFDPYVGSGTTPVAAKLLGFKYLGIDISEEYIKMATQRLIDFQKEAWKVDKEKSFHIVKKTFFERKERGEYILISQRHNRTGTNNTKQNPKIL